MFSAGNLITGQNELTITTDAGSWMIYDWIALEVPPGVQPAPVQTTLFTVRTPPGLTESSGKSFQPVQISVRHYGDDAPARVLFNGIAATNLVLRAGRQDCEVDLPAVASQTNLTVTVEVSGHKLESQTTVLQPVRRMTIYVLPHSHTDIGYTELQTAIEARQITNLLRGIEGARRTANYPPGARFVWNVEVSWVAELFLKRMSEAERAQFFAAVTNGWVGLNGMYLNELTGLCRPEELLRLFRFSTQLGEQCGVPIDSAMISDVPGCTWGTVTAEAQAGIRYFSVGPNYFSRNGDVLAQWEDKPFYWLSPSGRQKVLVWVPWRGYALSHLVGKITPELLAEYQAKLDRADYPYDISYLRWSGHGDNALPDMEICDFIKDWNARYAWPKLIIATMHDAFIAFEKRYGDQLPQVRGDWTPYWEDGAASSARETALNRASADRLTQGEALWAMLQPARYPAAAFDDAWRNVLLYSEHTWGADVSVSEPESKKTREQWEIKQGYARQADEQSRALLAAALDARPAGPDVANAFDVFNTASWPRTELVTLPADASAIGDRVTDERGKAVPSQRLADGELAFLAADVPPFAARRYTLARGNAPAGGQMLVQDNVLNNGRVSLRVDAVTGGITELRLRDVAGNLVDAPSGHALNEYLFLPGDNLAGLQTNGPVSIRVKERGPLVASLVITGPAPGCRSLTREVRLVAGLDTVETINTVEKERAAISPKPSDPQFAATGGKESVQFAFPFNVPAGVLQLDTPLGRMRPDADQIPGACKNWFTVSRWADVANADCGVAWVTADAPLIEVGGITANLLGSQIAPGRWRQTVGRTQQFYSWVMNNHWDTNYRAYQDGPTVFRYVLRPHARWDSVQSSQLAIGLSQPLIVAPARGARPPANSLVRITGAGGRSGQSTATGVLVTVLKPSDNGQAIIVRLFGSADHDEEANLEWAGIKPANLWLSDTSEKPLRKLDGPIAMPAQELVTLRAELR